MLFILVKLPRELSSKFMGFTRVMTDFNEVCKRQDIVNLTQLSLDCLHGAGFYCEELEKALFTGGPNAKSLIVLWCL